MSTIPQSISGLVLWLDAADSSTITGTTTVTSWRDKSSKAYNLVPGSGTTSYANNAITVNSSYLYAYGAVDLTTFTFFIISKTNNTTNNQPVFLARPNTSTSYSSTDGFSWYMDTGTQTRFYGSHPNTAQYITTSITTSTPNVYSVTGTSAGVFTQWNNGTLGNNATYTTRTSTAQGFIIGGEWTGSSVTVYSSCSDSVYEVLVYNNVLSTANRQTIEGYLAWKWNLQASLPAGHPYLSGPPSLSATIPQSISGLAVWVDASDVSSTGMSLSGTNVLTWVDKSGNGNTATSGGSAYPVITSNAINGKPALYLNNNTYLTGNISLTGTTVSCFAVVSQTVTPTPGDSRIISLATASAVDYDTTAVAIPLFTRNSGNLESFRAGTIANTTFGVASAVTESIFDGTNGYLYRNGNLIGSAASTGTFAVSKYGFGTRANVSSSEFWKGYFAEFIIYTTALTQLQRQTIEGYLCWKWGFQASLPSGHPYLSAPPSLSATIPQSISGLQVWFDGADPLGTGTAPLNAATVSTWIDKSGNGYNATTASGKSAGTYSSSNKSIYFPNSTSGYATTYPANPTAETMFVVFNNPSPSGNNNMVIGGQVGARSLGGGYSGSGGTGVVGVVGVLNNEVAWLAATPANSYTAGTTVLVTCNFTSTYNYIALNGGTFSTGGAPGFYANTTTYLGLDMYSTSYYYIGYEMEVIFYNSVLSTANQQKVEGYLAWKWGIQSSLPSGHPYKSAAPTTTPQAPTVPIAIPANTSLLFVNTSSFSKTFTLPAISSNPGRLLIFKDIYGSFSANPIFLSTTGRDGFENNGSTMSLSTNYGAWTFMNDAMTKWFLIDSYKNTMFVSSLYVSSIPNYLRISFAWYGSAYNSAGANVTATVLSIYNSGRTSFVAGNAELGDPQPGTFKNFWIDYYPPNSLTLKQAFFAGESSTVTFANLT